jgi:hypothetical protein
MDSKPVFVKLIGDPHVPHFIARLYSMIANTRNLLMINIFTVLQLKQELWQGMPMAIAWYR